MYEYTFGAAQQQAKLIWLAEVAASQVLRFNYKHALRRQGIVGKRHFPAAEHAADNLPQLRLTFCRRIDDVCRHLVFYRSRFTCKQERQDNDELKGVWTAHFFYLRMILF
jgi:hypothetical protein